MVERVARAICGRHIDWPGQADEIVIAEDGQRVPYWTNWVNDAHAAILAMREATSAMVKAEADLGGPADRMPATLVFDVMVVAALSEGTTAPGDP